MADQNLLHEAMKASEQDVIEQTMLEDKLKMADWEATDSTLSQQVSVFV